MRGVTEYFDASGFVKTDLLVGEIRTTKSDFALTIGLPKDAISQWPSEHSVSTQARLRETVIASNYPGFMTPDIGYPDRMLT